MIMKKNSILIVLSILCILLVFFDLFLISKVDIRYKFYLYDRIQNNGIDYFLVQNQDINRIGALSENYVQVYIGDDKNTYCNHVYYANTFQEDTERVYLYFNSALYTKDIYLAASNYDLINLPIIRDNILSLCKEKQEILLCEATDFDWDTVYIDRQAYAAADELKKKYQISDTFESLNTNYCYRLLFYQNEKLQKEEFVAYQYITFDNTIDKVDSDTWLCAEWIEQEDGCNALYLSVK